MRISPASVAGVALLLPLAACGGGNESPGATPTNISIAPSPAPSSPSGPASSPATASKPATDPSTAQTEGVQDATAAVAAAEAAVVDSIAVEVSRDDDDNQVVWEVTVRAGKNGRELRISATDGTVLSNRSERLHESQLGEAPKVTAQEAIKIAEKRVPDGVVTDAELAREDGQRVWDVTVELGDDDEWELWIDASSGKILHEERD